MTFAAQFEASGQDWIVVTARGVKGGHDEGGGDEGVDGGRVFGLQISQIPAKMISRKICVAEKCIFHIVTVSQCGNFRNFMSLRFSVKPISGNLEVRKLPF